MANVTEAQPHGADPHGPGADAHGHDAHSAHPSFLQHHFDTPAQQFEAS
jgi:hypothetical protein